MAVNINTILNWFKTGERPTQSQFWDTWQSFWHKDESIPQNKIENLEMALDIKADKNNSLSFKGNLPQSINLDDYTETGYYIQRQNIGATSGINYPSEYAGKLQVVSNLRSSGSKEFVYQVYHAFGTEEAIYYRNYYYSLGWQAWKKINDYRDESIPSAADLNNYTETGIYYQNVNAYAETGINYPVALAGKLEVSQSTSSSFVYQTYHAYGPYNYQYTRTRYNSTWYAWKRVVTTSV